MGLYSGARVVKDTLRSMFQRFEIILSALVLPFVQQWVQFRPELQIQLSMRPDRWIMTKAGCVCFKIASVLNDILYTKAHFI